MWPPLTCCYSKRGKQIAQPSHVGHSTALGSSGCDGSLDAFHSQLEIKLAKGKIGDHLPRSWNRKIKTETHSISESPSLTQEITGKFPYKIKLKREITRLKGLKGVDQPGEWKYMPLYKMTFLQETYSNLQTPTTILSQFRRILHLRNEGTPRSGKSV